MAGLTTTNQSAFIPEIWLNTALGRLKQYVVIAPRITSNNDMEIGRQFKVGNILSIPVRGAVTTELVTEGNAFTVQSPTATSINVTLNKHRASTINVTSEALAEVNQDIIAGYLADMVRAMASGIEADMHAMLVAGTPGGNTIAATGNVTEAQILTARKILVDNLADELDDKYALISTAQGNALRLSANTARFDATGRVDNISNAHVGSPIQGPGALGHVLGFDIFESQLVQVNSGTSNNLFFCHDSAVVVTRPLPMPERGEGAVGTVMQDPQSGMHFRMFTFFNGSTGTRQLTLDCLYGYTMLRAAKTAMIQSTGG
jgi:hypothetical protein